MNIKELVRDIPDFPKPGVVFKDITPVLADADALRWIIDALADRYRGRVDAVVGIESRGFIAGAPVAYAMDVGLVVVRKPGKLPHTTHAVTYELEYGTDSLEIHEDGTDHGERVLIVDDLLATGGTMAATRLLVESVGGTVAGCCVLIELEFLQGRAKLEGTRVESLLKF